MRINALAPNCVQHHPHHFQSCMVHDTTMHAQKSVSKMPPDNIQTFGFNFNFIIHHYGSIICHKPLLIFWNLCRAL